MPTSSLRITRSAPNPRSLSAILTLLHAAARAPAARLPRAPQRKSVSGDKAIAKDDDEDEEEEVVASSFPATAVADAEEEEEEEGVVVVADVLVIRRSDA